MKLSDKQRQVAKDLALTGAAVTAGVKIYETGKDMIKGIKKKVKAHKDKKEFMNESGTKWKETDTDAYELQKAEFLDDGKISRDEGKLLRKYKNNLYKEGE